MEADTMILYAVLGGVIGFIGGMVGLVLGVVRFPFILEAETSASITAGTNLSVSTLGAITGAINHYRQNNFDFKIFLVMALSGAIGALIGSFLTDMVSVVLLLIIIMIIVSYEAIDLMKKSGKVRKRVNEIDDFQLTALSPSTSLPNADENLNITATHSIHNDSRYVFESFKIIVNLIRFLPLRNISTSKIWSHTIRSFF